MYILTLSGGEPIAIDEAAALDQFLVHEVRRCVASHGRWRRPREKVIDGLTYQSLSLNIMIPLEKGNQSREIEQARRNFQDTEILPN